MLVKWRFAEGKQGDTGLIFYVLTVWQCDSTIHVKLEKFKRGRSPSLHLAKEGDFARNHSMTLILSINIQIPVEILKMMRYSILRMA